jgi:hypothetical protein
VTSMVILTCLLNIFGADLDTLEFAVRRIIQDRLWKGHSKYLPGSDAD